MTKESRQLIRCSSIQKGMQDQCKYAGTPAIIVKTQLCDVGCLWCDSQYTWHARSVDKTDTLANQNGKWTVYTADDLCLQILQTIELEELAKPHVVFTGGEPCLYDLQYITKTMHQQGFTTQIETSGTKAIMCHESTWITLSPKIGMPSGLQVHTSALRRANEIMMVIGKQIDLDKLLQLLDTVDVSGKEVYLTPQSRSLKATDLCIDACASYGFKLALKTNHMIGL